jgi:hypothetical protein
VAVSDDLVIRHGAVVAVDTETLRAAALDLDWVRERLDDATALARDAGRIMMFVAERDANGIASFAGERADERARGVERAGEETAALAGRLRGVALVYEYVELAARRDAARDHAERSALEAQLAALRADSPGIDFAAGLEGLGYAVRAPWELIGQAWGAGILFGPTYPLLAAASTWILAGAVRIAGQGVVPAAARLVGTAAPVVVTQATQGAGRPLSSLGQAAARIAEKAEIRVERYAMPGGTRQFVVYIAGTRSDTAFDMASNVELYDGRKSASYEAVREALHRAGAQPGDTLHAVGHSQGGMIADRLALEGEYDVRTVVTFGSPIQAEVPASTLVVDVRHDDDVVAALAAGGSAQGVGRPDSFVAQRTAEPNPVPDLGLMAHVLDRYQATAALLDASRDPRMVAVRGLFDELGRADSVTVTEFTATRPTVEVVAPGRSATPAASSAAAAG